MKQEVLERRQRIKERRKALGAARNVLEENVSEHVTAVEATGKARLSLFCHL